MPDGPLVVFAPSGLRGRFGRGTQLLRAARELGVDLDSVCGGRGICTRCQVRVGEGEFAKHGIASSNDHLTPPTDAELRQRDDGLLKEGRRLSCQARIGGDLVIDVPAESQVHRQIVRKRADVRAVEVDPVVRPMYVEIPEPDMRDPASHLRRLERALRETWGVRLAGVDAHVLRKLHRTLEDGGYKATAVVRRGKRLIDVRPGFHDRIYGLAVDVGSTTIAMHLCDLSSGEVLASAGRMNPQIRFGEDLMSRVSYAMMNEGGARAMTDAVREALDGLARETAAEAGVPPEDVMEVAIVGNPVMHHLVLGLDPSPLGFAPFALATDDAVVMLASDIGLTLNPGSRIYVLPCIAGHVGADAAGVVLCEMPYRNDEMTLIVDVGTNAEIVLGNRDRLLAASSPTGPAFEGAQIGAGQRAAPGAIERVRIDPGTLEPRFKIIGDDRWSDEEGFDAEPTGVCGSGIIEVLAEMYLAGLLTADGAIDGAMAARTGRVIRDGRTFAYVLRDGSPRIVVSQNDVRQIQLAKGALYAGARLLMDRMGVETVDRIALAGAFGSHIDAMRAMVLGMIPDCDLARVGSAGNAAGDGARIALLNGRLRKELEDRVRRIEKVETAVEPRFQEHFVDAMAIPHKTAPYPRLAGAVALPEREPARSEGGSRGAGRGRRGRAGRRARRPASPRRAKRRRSPGNRGSLRRHAPGQVGRHRPRTAAQVASAPPRVPVPREPARPAGDAGHRLPVPAQGRLRSRLFLARTRLQAGRQDTEVEHGVLETEDRAQRGTGRGERAGSGGARLALLHGLGMRPQGRRGRYGPGRRIPGGLRRRLRRTRSRSGKRGIAACVLGGTGEAPGDEPVARVPDRFFRKPVPVLQDDVLGGEFVQSAARQQVEPLGLPTDGPVQQTSPDALVGQFPSGSDGFRPSPVLFRQQLLVSVQNDVEVAFERVVEHHALQGNELAERLVVNVPAPSGEGVLHQVAELHGVREPGDLFVVHLDPSLTPSPAVPRGGCGRSARGSGG